MSKHTDQQNLVFGIHGVQRKLQFCAGDTAGQLYIRNGKLSRKLGQLRRLAVDAGLEIVIADRYRLDKLCSAGVHQGVALLLEGAGQNDAAIDNATDGATEQAIDGDCDLGQVVAASDLPLLLVLDQVQDPRNFGACMRTADAAGADAVLCTKRNSAPLSAVARKAASGAAEDMPVARVANLRQGMQALQQQGLWLVGMDGDAEHSIFEIDLNVPVAIVVGAEGKGLRRLTRESCDHLARIPMTGNAESLNVSVAAAVALFEAVRQRSAMAVT